MVLKSHWWTIVIAILVGGAVTVALWPRSDEPTYKGKVLSWWLSRYAKAEYDTGDENNSVVLEANEAVKQIGTNAIPKLVEWLPDSSSRLRTLPFPNTPTHSALAVSGFRILGERASGAVPEVSRMLKDTNAVHDAVLCLALVGEPGLMKLIGALGDPNQMDRPYIAMLLGGIPPGTNAEVATTTLVACLTEKDSELVAAAVRALGKIGSQSTQKLPAVARALTNNAYEVRVQATNALYMLTRPGVIGQKPGNE